MFSSEKYIAYFKSYFKKEDISVNRNGIIINSKF